MSGMLIVPRFMPALDDNGDPVSGAELYVYLDRTTTLTSIYADASLTTPLTNPVLANAGGQFPIIYAADGSAFSVGLMTPIDFEALDDIFVGSASNGTVPVGNALYVEGAGPLGKEEGGALGPEG